MSNHAITREQARTVDRRAIEEYGMTGLVLMENAGRGVVDILVQALAEATENSDGARARLGRRVVICCGKGNNAGDGFVIARHLDLRGYEPCVLIWAEPKELTGDAAANFEILHASGVSIEVYGNRHDHESVDRHLEGAAMIVDALLGTGARGDPRPPLDAVIDQINLAGVPILAVDLPSGLDCDTGQAASRTIRAAITCTFVTIKRGFLFPEASQYLGRVHVLDIGAPRRLVEEIVNAANR